MENRDIYDLGLKADVSMLMRSTVDRRRILQLGAFGLTALLTGCQPPAPPSGGGGVAVATSVSSCSTNIPGETAGPYPADGSNASQQTLNALDISGIVRKDIRTSIGTGNVAEGVPLTLELTLVNTNQECKPLEGYALYAWHCTRDGNYSMYSNGVTEEDFLRGVQATDAEGKVSFQTIFPGCYLGRWPHIHFEIYPSLEKATSQGNVVHISQLGFPEGDCQTVYAIAGYESSAKNLPQITLATDNVFSDGYESQMATVTGNATDGYVAKLTVGVAV
ncbi:MAG: intradiol ring-cleavage dioxygenase [Caldilineaceae bacterium]